MYTTDVPSPEPLSPLCVAVVPARENEHMSVSPGEHVLHMNVVVIHLYIETHPDEKHALCHVLGSAVIVHEFLITVTVQNVRYNIL